jgi:hypothetical protein
VAKELFLAFSAEKEFVFVFVADVDVCIMMRNERNGNRGAPIAAYNTTR